MAKNNSPSTPPETVISIIGAGMSLEGDTETDGSLRIEGTVRGNVRAGKSVVIGKDGLVDGSIFTQDAVVAGRVSGGIHAGSRLELHSTSVVDGEIVAHRMQVEEGAQVQGKIAVGESALKAASQAAPEAGQPQAERGDSKEGSHQDGSKKGGQQPDSGRVDQAG
jgi:cytoskeletal protein CcmA (bactofilin family)